MRSKIRHTGVVYFIGPEASLYRSPDMELCVKIGFTSGCPMQRMHAFQAGSPQVLELIAYTDGSLKLEKAFHEAFAPLASHREWFFLAERLSSFLAYLDGDDKHVSRTRLIDAIDDVLSPRSSIPHPSIDEQSWRSSADMAPLIPFFPELMR
ncbi:MAG: hypothetical protein CMH85_01275 [Novosphingobium sp.]|nr:hypothetical protein [Novosphingobium sp.]